MSHFSPCVFLVWAILSITLSGFYFSHLWKFDRFQCLNLMRDRQGAFKRIMTYSYLVAIPLLLTWTVGFTVIKYKEGFITLPTGAVLPKPFGLWTPHHQAAYFPLNMAWAFSWVADTLSHLEELCFWFFLIRAGPLPTPWFKSKYFKIWMGGSILSMISVVTATSVTKSDPLKNEAWLQITGTFFGLLITIGFLPILWVFPKFIKTVKSEGADMDAVIRLVKFHDLNIVRIIFRFMFVIPGFILAVDGLRPHTHLVNASMIYTDILAMTAGVGFIVQSSITLTIFFPRNLELETNRWLHASSAPRQQVTLPKTIKQIFKQSSQESKDTLQLEPHHPKQYLLTDSPISSKVEISMQPSLSYVNYPPHSNSPWVDEHCIPLRGAQHQLHHTGNSLGLYDPNLGVVSKDTSQLNPLALYYTSPIDLLDVPRVRTQQ